MGVHEVLAREAIFVHTHGINAQKPGVNSPYVCFYSTFPSLVGCQVLSTTNSDHPVFRNNLSSIHSKSPINELRWFEEELGKSDQLFQPEIFWTHGVH